MEGKSFATWDKRRTIVFTTFNSVIFGGFYVPYYAWLNVTFGESSVAIALKKVVFDSFITTPLLYLPAFFTATQYYPGLSSGKTADDLRQAVHDKYLNTFAASLIVYLPAKAVNFIYVPPTLRVPFDCLFEFFWDLGLSIYCLDDDKEDKTVMQ